MSKKLPTPNTSNSEEIDLIVFFNLIGNAFSRFFNFLGAILKSIFSVIIYALQVLFKNWKIVLTTLLISAGIGFFLEKTKPVIYSSNLLVEPYFNSKYQLVSNINYFNSLIENEDYKALKDIFKTNDAVIKALKGFEIENGPETENDRIIAYNDFIKKLDTIKGQKFSYEEFVKNRSVYSGSVFLIKAKAKKPDIFEKLEQGILNSFHNEYSINEMKRRDTLIKIEKQNLLDQLKQVDSLKSIYINVLQKNSEKQSSNIKFGDISVSGNDNLNTKEYELLQEEQKIRNQLKELEERKIEEDRFYDVLSSFQKVGKIEYNLKNRYLLPIISFVLLIAFYLIKRTIRYTLSYEE